MNETLGRGYARIDDIRAARGEPFSRVEESDPPPQDQCQFVYFTLFIAGGAFLLPFNSFIMAVDFFKTAYPNSTIIYDITTVYIASACVAVVINNLLIYFFHYTTRITFGILFTLCIMVIVTICNVGYKGFSPHISYIINLVAIGLIAFGCTVQQASYYGFTGCLPAKYTQAVMAGESAAGFWVCADCIITKYAFAQPQRSSLAFFTFSITILLIHSLLHHLMMRHPFVTYYLKLMRETKLKRRVQLHLTPNDDAALVGQIDNETTDTSYGVLKLQSPPLTVSEPVSEEREQNTFSFSNPVYSPSASVPATILETEQPSSSTILSNHRPSYTVEDVVDSTSERPVTTWKAIKNGVLARWAVARAIYPYMVSIGLLYFTTLSLYPGITSEMRSCRFGTWMPIILMSAYNCSDLIGKIMASWPYEWSRSQLLMASGLRLLLVPLVLLCTAPRHSPHIVGDMYPIMFCVVLGFTNGLFSSVTMMLAPARIGREYREIAGNVMTLSYNGGLLSGSLVSYLLLSMLGTTSAPPCRLYSTGTLPALSIPTTPVLNSTILTSLQH